MSTIIKFDLKELKKLSNDKNSCVIEKKVTQNLALQPWCLGNLKESVKNLLDYKIGKFDKEFNGIVLSYKNLRILQNVGTIRNDNADVNFEVEADYFIFRPHVGATLRGIVNKKSSTHLGILVHRVFNVVIPRPTEEPGNKWIGASVEEGQQVVFRVMVLDLFGALPYIRGELEERSIALGPDEDDEDKELNTSQQIKVSHVNFDKTKPSLQKQIGDIPAKSSKSSKTKMSSLSKNIVGHSTIESQVYKHQNSSSSKIVERDTPNKEKIKSKRQSKITEGDLKQAVVNLTPCKKHKQDI